MLTDFVKMAVVDVRKFITRGNSPGKSKGGDWFGRGGGGRGEGGKGLANHSGIGELLGGVEFLGGGVDLGGGGGGHEFVFGLVLPLGDGTLGESRNLTGERPSLHLRACLGHLVVVSLSRIVECTILTRLSQTSTKKNCFQENVNSRRLYWGLFKLLLGDIYIMDT